MKVQHWIFSVRYSPDGQRVFPRRAVVGPAAAVTVEAALHLACAPESVRAAICADPTVRKFVEGLLDPEAPGYYVQSPGAVMESNWLVCIGSVHEVIA